MTWNELEYGWQIAFSSAWEAFRSGTIPIGAAILNNSGELVSTGQNMIYVEQADGQAIYGSNLAHAELNAIAQLKCDEHPDVRSYTLYTTTELCILCFGAIVMGNIRHFKFAARDGYAEAVGKVEYSDYVKTKNILAEGPHGLLEAVQAALSSYYELENRFPNHEIILSHMALDCPHGAEAGNELFKERVLRRLANENRPVSEAFSVILEQLTRKSK